MSLEVGKTYNTHDGGSVNIVAGPVKADSWGHEPVWIGLWTPKDRESITVCFYNPFGLDLDSASYDQEYWDEGNEEPADIVKPTHKAWIITRWLDSEIIDTRSGTGEPPECRPDETISFVQARQP